MTASVIIPAHNMAKRVAKAVETAWSQDPMPIEVIVADDGSTDGTADVAEAAGARVLRLPKGNGNVARNAGYRASTGEVLFFLDSDDWYMPGKIAAHLARHQIADDSVVLDPCTAISEDNVELRLCGPSLNGPIDYRMFTSRTHWYGGSAMSLKRAKLDAIGGWREELPSQQDVDLWLRITHHNGPGFVLGTSYTYYLQSTGSLSRTPKKVQDNLAILMQGLPFLTQAEQRRLYSMVVFTAADNLPIGKAWPYLRTAMDRVGDPRFAKAVLRSLGKTFRGNRV